MASKYQKRHYEDVAELIQRTNGCSIRYTAEQFADLFAADNPPKCIYAGKHDGPCDTACRTGGCLVGGFDEFGRERFLKACGLEDG